MKRTLITGINGFLANRLVDFCVGDEKNIFGISRCDNHKTGDKNRCTIFYGDILNFEFLKRIISENEIDLIYHCAAQSIVRTANTNPLYCFQDNIIGTTNVLEAVRQINPKIKIVVASSDKAYGEHINLPYLENMALQSGDPYSTSKACADLIAQSYFKTYGLNVSIVRSANIYGVGDMNLSRLIPNTITKILRKQKPIVYSGVLQYKREFVFVDDVCNAYDMIAKNGMAGEAYNVGTGEVCEVGQLLAIICNVMDWQGGVEIVDKTFPEINLQYISSEKIKLIGWTPKFTLEEGLEKSIKWYTNKFKDATTLNSY